MDTILSVDLGSSAAKLVSLGADGSVRSMQRVPARDLESALEAYHPGGSLPDVSRIVLTGVGASYVDGSVRGLPTRRVDEFSASAAGALALTGQERGLVVTMGTGTAFLWAEGNGVVRHLCGSGVGGGTLTGLCRALTGAEGIGQILDLAAWGDLSQVDLSIRDVTKDPAPTLDPTLTASNFGRAVKDTSPADLTVGVINLVLQTIGTMSVLACQSCGTGTVILTGSMTALPQALPNFRNFQELYGIRYIIPGNAAFATAIGAGLCSLRE